MRIFNTFFSLFVYLLAVAHLEANQVRDKHVTAELISEVTAIQPGIPFTVALLFEIDPKWHTYWVNPGVAGLPTAIDWVLPQGFEAGPIQWSVPKIFNLNGLINYGYEDEVYHLVEITPPIDLQKGNSVRLSATTTFLMCSDICIQGSANLHLDLVISDSTARTNEEWRSALANARAALPENPNPWQFFSYGGDDTIELLINTQGKVNDAIEHLYFFSMDGQVDPSEAQSFSIKKDKILLKVTRAKYTEHLEILRGVLFSKDGLFSQGVSKAVYVETPIQPGIAPAVGLGISTGAIPTGTGFDSPTFIPTLGLAFLGGLVLNLMPCVFPVLGLKILSVVKRTGEDRGTVIQHGIVYTLGILVSFWLLSLLLILLRAGGKELGWGFQLQSPSFVFCIATFLFVFALNLSGLFEVAPGLIFLGNRLRSRNSLSGSFLSGTLATLVATPCAAPFLAPALGAALTLRPLPSLSVFTLIGLGLALPFLLLSIFPRSVSLLPRPGRWMETVKQFLAFPLYGVVGYLLWVLSGQLRESELLETIFSFVLIALACWIFGRWVTPIVHPIAKRVGAVATASILIGGLYSGLPDSSPEAITWLEWSPERVNLFQSEGRPVFVDFTARWCATCLTNKRLVFSSKKVQQAFQEKEIVALKADWTNRDPEITAALADFGRVAVPFNVLYVPGLDEPLIFPEILTPRIVLKKIDPL